MMPMKSSTACSTSRTASGGARRLRISDRLSDLMEPTALRAP